MAFEQFREQVVSPLLKAVYELSNTSDVPKEQRLERAAEAIGIAGEYTDSELAGLLPGPIGAIGGWLVDLPIVDDAQKEYLWKPIAEVSYQALKAFRGVVDTADLFVQKIVNPVLELIPTLTDPSLTGAQKHAKVKGIIFGVFMAVGEGIAELLPAGLKPFALYALNTDEAQKFLDWLSGFLAELLYNIWKVVSGEPQLIGATA